MAIEMKTLTIGSTTYDVVDSDAVHCCAQSLTDAQKAQARANIGAICADDVEAVEGVGIASVVQTTTSTADDGNNVITVTLTDGTTSTFKVQNGSKGSTGAQGPQGETGPAGADGKDYTFDATAYGLPVIYLTGDTSAMTKDNAVTLGYVYGDISGSCTCKWQGSSSLAYEKKNYTIKFDNAFEAVEGWGAQTKYCFKANFIDHSHARNVVSAKLWGQIAKNRTGVDDRLTALPNAGAIDGFPCMIILNDEFHGLYTWNIPKDGWMFGMGSGDREAIVCADAWVDSTAFRAPATLDGDFELEYVSDENDSGWVLTSLNNMINAVVASDGSDIDTTLSQYIDIDSAIDYLLYTSLLMGVDMTNNNYLLATYDGVKWFFSAYDMDSTYGIMWDGKSFLSASGYPLPTFFSHRLMELIMAKKRAEVKARYVALRDDVMSEDNVSLEFTNFASLIPSTVLAEDVRKWPTVPSTAASNVEQIANWYRMRIAVMDEDLGISDEGDAPTQKNVPCGNESGAYINIDDAFPSILGSASVDDVAFAIAGKSEQVSMPLTYFPAEIFSLGGVREQSNLLNAHDSSAFPAWFTPTYNMDGSVTAYNPHEVDTGAPKWILTGTLPAGKYTFMNLSGGAAFVQTSEDDWNNYLAVGGSFTLDYDGASYLRLMVQDIPAGQTFVCKLQVVAGESVLPYVPYGRLVSGAVEAVVKEGAEEKRVVIDMAGNIAASLPDGTHDEVRVYSDGRVELVKRVETIVYDGSDDEEWLLATTDGGVRFDIVLDTPAKIQENAEISNLLCTNFTAVAPDNTWLNTLGASLSNGLVLNICIPDMSLAEFVYLLKEKPMTVQYERAVPEIISLGTVDRLELTGSTADAWLDSNLEGEYSSFRYQKDINIILARI